MAEQIMEVEGSPTIPRAPTFDNTMVALRRPGQLLNRVNRLSTASPAQTPNDELQKVQEYEAPRLAAHAGCDLPQRKTLCARQGDLREARIRCDLDPESLRLVEYDYQQFVKAGANLSDADKAKLKKLNEEDSTLENAFMNKLLAAAKAGAYSTTDSDALAGLSEAQMAAAAAGAPAAQAAGLGDPAAEHHAAARPGLS